MEVVRISPRGYCHGVVAAMVKAIRAARDPSFPRPLYILGMLVHNRYVVEAFARLGVETLDGADRLSLLETIERGTVIFTAHGVSPAVRRRAAEKGLTVVDATCPDVLRTHELIANKARQGYAILYIGRAGHPEPEGAVGVAPEHVYLVETVEDVDRLPDFTGRPVAITNQTTMSQWDVADIVAYARERFPHAEVHDEICLATQVRQVAVAKQARGADLTIVVGDPRSNNTARLAQVSEQIAGVKAYRVSDVEEIDPRWLFGARRVAVTSGASTPTAITNEVIAYLERFRPEDPATWQPVRRVTLEDILPKIPPESEIPHTGRPPA